MYTIIGCALIVAGILFIIQPELDRIGSAIWGVNDQLERSNATASKLLGLAEKVDRAWRTPKLVPQRTHTSQRDADLAPEAFTLLEQLERNNRSRL